MYVIVWCYYSRPAGQGVRYTKASLYEDAFYIYIYFTFFRVKKIVCYTEDFVI